MEQVGHADGYWHGRTGKPDRDGGLRCVQVSASRKSESGPVTVNSQVSVRDVAVLAGVSIGTVSNVMNAPERVSESTARRVREAIEKLGWVPNESARQLRGGRSRAIGMVVMDIANPFFTDVARGADRCLNQAGYSVHLANSDQVSEQELTLLQRFEHQRVGGVLLAPIEEDAERVDVLQRGGIPVVLVDRVGASSGSCSVGVDNLVGGQIAGEHLLERGHRRIAYVGGPDTISHVRDRRAGLDEAVRRAGGAASVLWVRTGALSLEAGMAAAAEIAVMPRADRPTAVFAACDLVAIGLLQGLMTGGLKVPDDVAIIGFDDIAFAAAAAVPLSSIRQPSEEIGRQAAELLISEIEAADSGELHTHQNVRFAPKLVPRRSTGG